MADLIGTLQVQHQFVLSLSEKLSASIAARDTAAIATQLTQLKSALLEHLTLEDTQLYPGLLRLAEQSRQENLATVAKAFSSNMERVTAALLSFLTKYDGRAIELTAFEKDWSAIQAALTSRIKSEENSLYPLYSRAETEAERLKSR